MSTKKSFIKPTSKRGKAADALKIMIQELVSENLDLKTGYASNNNSGLKAAGSLIDNFGSGGELSNNILLNKNSVAGGGIGPGCNSPETALPLPGSTEEQSKISELQAKIWSLESEISILTSKL